MEDKQLFQGRFRHLKESGSQLDPHVAFGQALQWLKIVKSGGVLLRVKQLWDEAPIKRGDVSQLLRRCQEIGSFTEAIRLVGGIFSDPFKLGKCFPLPLSDLPLVGGDVDDVLNLIDSAEVDSAVQSLIEASPSIANAMSYALRSLTAEVTATAPSMSKGDIRIRAVRIALVASGVPNVTRAFVLRSLSSAPKHLIYDVGRNLLFTWGLERSVSWLNASLSEAIQSENLGFAFDKVEPIALIMSEMWKYNQGLDTGHKLPASIFINAELSRHIAEDESFLDRDFVTWYSSSEGGPVVSFMQCPFMLDTPSKARIIQVASEIEQRQRFHQAAGGGDVPFLIIRIRRDHLVEDTMMQLASIPKSDLRKPLKVQFVGEEGVDAGGVRKEYFLLMLRQLLDPSFGMFSERDSKTKVLWFNPDSLEAQLQFELVGVLIGLAISNRVIIDVPFPKLLYRTLLEDLDLMTLTMLDLESVDPALAHGFAELLNFTGDVEHTFMRTFEVSREAWGAVQTIELVPGGSGVAVTQFNRDDYVARYMKWYLVDSVKEPVLAFRRGFYSVIDESLLKDLLISAEELELMVVGVRSLDFMALEQSARYDDGYDENSRTIKTFWKVAHSLSDEDKRTLLRFVTGTDRVPIRGLSDVHIVISRAGSDSSLLPSSHTCFDHLLLPDYGDDEEKLRSKLKLALEHAEGFFTR